MIRAFQFTDQEGKAVRAGDVITFKVGRKTKKVVVKDVVQTRRPMTEADRQPGDTDPVEDREIIEVSLVFE